MNTKMVPISELAEVNPKTELHELKSDSLVSFIPMADVTESGYWVGRQVRRLNDVRVGYTAFAEDDVLFAKITPCMENGKGAHVKGLVNGLGFGSTEFHVLRAKGDNDPRYIFHWLQTKQIRLRAIAYMGGSAGQQRVQKDFFVNYRVPEKAPSEQSRIAYVLDTIDEAIARTEAVIAKLKQVRAGMLHDLLNYGLDEHGELRDPVAHPEQFKDSLFGWFPREWEMLSAEDISERITDGEHQTPTRSKSGVYLLSARNVLVGELKLDDVDFISEREYERICKRCRPEAGDILISCSGTIGRVCVVPEDFRCGLVRSVAIIKPKRSLVHSPFFELVSNESIIQRQIVAMQRQLAQANLFQSEIRRLLYPVPTLTEQKAIADVARKQMNCIKQEIDERDKLCLIKSGLQDDLLTGRVRVPAAIMEGAERA